MLSPEQIKQYEAELVVVVPQLQELEVAIEQAQCLFDEAELLQEKSREETALADQERQWKHGYKTSLATVNNWKSRYQENHDQLAAAWADKIKTANANTSDGTAIIQLWKEIDIFARRGLEELSTEVWMSAEFAMEGIEKAKAAIAEHTKEADKKAREAYDKRAEAYGILQKAGLPSDACK